MDLGHCRDRLDAGRGLSLHHEVLVKLMKIPRKVRQRASAMAERMFDSPRGRGETWEDVRNKRRWLREAYLEGWQDGVTDVRAVAPGLAAHDDAMVAQAARERIALEESTEETL